MKIKCPDCPDGGVWTEKGPTGINCPRCHGEAFLEMPYLFCHRTELCALAGCCVADPVCNE